MNRREHIQFARNLQNENRKYPDFLVEINVAKYQLEAKHPGMNKYPIKAFRSNRFVAQLFEEKGGIVRLTVNRTAIDRDGNYLDGITWEELQQIKFECGYGDRDAVEVFPADADVVHVANMRHLWVLPEPLPFIWRGL